MIKTSTFRNILLLFVFLCLFLLLLQIFLYPTWLKLPGSTVFLVEPILLLIFHAFLIFWFTRANYPINNTVLMNASIFGFLSGGLEILHISIENFAHLSPHAGTISTGLFMLTLFLLWGTAGFFTVRKTNNLTLGWQTGFWSALGGMLLTSTSGSLLLLTSLPQLELNNTGSPDLLRSGWSDIHAFTIADMFESVAKVLLIGPIIGILLGTLGGFIASLFRKISP